MTRNILVLAIFLAGFLPAAVNAAPPRGNAFYSSVPAAYMDDPRRIEWQMPEKVVDHLLVRKGDAVADIGAGTGYFSLLFSKRVGTAGKVYAVDVDERMVDLVARRAKKEGLKNVRSILSTPTDPLLPTLALDLVFVCDTYLFFEDRQGYLARLRNSLKTNGRLAIVSFNMRADIPGAPPRHKMVSRDQTVREAEQAGFALEAEYFFLPYQDFLVFVKR